MAPGGSRSPSRIREIFGRRGRLHACLQNWQTRRHVCLYPTRPRTLCAYIRGIEGHLHQKVSVGISSFHRQASRTGRNGHLETPRLSRPRSHTLCHLHRISDMVDLP